MGHLPPAACFRDLSRRRHRRVQAHSFRSPRSRVRIDSWLFHRIFGWQAGRIHAHRPDGNRPGRDARHNLFSRRVADPIPHARRLTLPRRPLHCSPEPPHLDSRRSRLPHQSRFHLPLAERHPLDPPAFSLRPVDALGMESPDAARVDQHRHHRFRGRRRREAGLMPLWLFAFLAALAIVSALGVILQRNPIHSLLSLVMTLFVIGVLFIGEGAITVGFLQVIVYAGAIMVLFLFVIWLLNLQLQNLEPGRIGLKFFAGIGAAALGAILLVLLTSSSTGAPISVTAEYGSIDTLADTLFSDYLIAFEVTSMLLLVAVVGSIALARRIPGSGLKTTSSVARGSESNTTKLVSGVTR